MSRRSAAKPTSSSGVLTIGLDIGYGITKAVTTDQVLTFPSVLGHAREIKFQQDEIAQRHPGDQIRDDDGLWFAGDLALSQLPPGELLRLRGRTADEATMGNAFRLRLAKVAIGKLLAGAWNRDVLHLRIATGLPVDHMRDAPDLKAACSGSIRRHRHRRGRRQHLRGHGHASALWHDLCRHPHRHRRHQPPAHRPPHRRLRHRHLHCRSGARRPGRVRRRRERVGGERRLHRPGAHRRGAGARLLPEDPLPPGRGGAPDRHLPRQRQTGQLRSRRPGRRWPAAQRHPST
ncbi:MAG: hypothetical protein IPK19_38010 [Chloroflexi bacterium]|nr:hypothetical protein [Chloroflexota bacterium]